MDEEFMKQLGGGGGGEADKRDQEEEFRKQQEQQEQMKNQILNQVLDQAARARLTTLKTVKKSKSEQIENILLNMARSGQIRGKLSEEQFIGLLEQLNERLEGKTSKVKFDRRRTNLDDDDDEDYDL